MSSSVALDRRATGTFSERIFMLDGWRGLAALAVLLQHLGYDHVGVQAVMLFFVISGYCITASLENHRRKGLALRAFLARRVRRIYPPYLLSVAFYLVTRLVKSAGALSGDLHRSLLEYLQNVTLTQWVTLTIKPAAFAFNNPTLFVSSYWSLCYEEQFYFVMGLILAICAALRWSSFGLIVSLALCGLAWNVRFPSISYGIFLEYWLPFSIGCLVFYRLCRFDVAQRRSVDLALVALAAWSGWLSWFGPDRNQRYVYYEWLVASGFALTLIASRRFDERFKASRVGGVLRQLGTISFSLYLVHQFNMVSVERVLSLVIPMSRLPEPLPMSARVAGHLALAATFWYLCERPFLGLPQAIAPASSRASA